MEVAAIPVANLPRYRLESLYVDCPCSLVQIDQNKMSQLELGPDLYEVLDRNKVSPSSSLFFGLDLIAATR